MHFNGSGDGIRDEVHDVDQLLVFVKGEGPAEERPGTVQRTKAETAAEHNTSSATPL